MAYDWAKGGSVVVAPSNAYVIEPQYGREEIIYADCYADQIRMAKVMYDVLGHYRRWDISRITTENSKVKSWMTRHKPASIEQLLRAVPPPAEKYDVDERRVTALLTELIQQWTDISQTDTYNQQNDS